MSTVQPIPENYPRITPVLLVDGAADAITFYADVLGATERLRMDAPGGKVGHAELELGGSLLMLADEQPEMGMPGPRSVGGSPVTLHVYVEDVDAVFDRAMQAGATVVEPVQLQFYGDRTARFEDPFGHSWNVATHVEDVSGEEMARRAAEWMASEGGG